ncbi:hypothetical protein CEP14_13275 [Cylindrospermopsis raciborskii C04]|uniref:Uncharacterized protein n=1 Tax=Cylindrospermopsis raciborskii C07 TaxID=2014886 RepID=A0ABX4WJE0_9CYAN|nr:hypothetical protein [Cylindrospermopsis raciborskii]PNJ93278.1 hypothetical protein CEP15_14965 [Cylindrospermopsis raciborskii C07]PNJ93602.1 hypothetical protein CEP14_13275 [Cylindrospermopsis raciborskii C04]PNJ94462.1 hypothetical protein CEP13_10785 [Cylindrospermopsis raciborskii C03]
MTLFDKIKKEHNSPTVKVPPRQDDIIPKQEVIESESNFNHGELHKYTEPDVSPISIASLEKELQSFPSLSNKKIVLRLEEDIYEGIRVICYEHDITVETLLEAYFSLCKSQPKLMDKILKEAQSRIKGRTKAGNIRSLITKIKNLTSK